MQFFSLKSLRVRLLLLVLVAVIPAWGVIAYTASEQRRIAVAEIQRNVLQLAEFIAHEEEQDTSGCPSNAHCSGEFIQKKNTNPVRMQCILRRSSQTVPTLCQHRRRKTQRRSFLQCGSVQTGPRTPRISHGSGAQLKPAISRSVIIMSAALPANPCWSFLSLIQRRRG